jgi:uncharacterized protein (DUF58 family)
MERALGSVAAGAVLTLVALLFDASPLFVPGIALIALGAIASGRVASVARATTIERTLERHRVLEDEPLEATLTVRSRGLGLPVATVTDPLAQHPIELPHGAREFSTPIVAAFPRRGRKRIAPPAIAISDALGLARATRSGAESGDEVLVLPRTDRVRYLEARGSLHLDTGGNGRPESLAAVDFDGLRAYRPGSPASRIHWPAVARGRGLIERKLEPEGDHRPLVVLDARAERPVGDVDAAVRAAASLVLDLARGSGCSLLLPGERRAAAIDSDLVGWPAAHVRLALVQGGPSSPAPAMQLVATSAAAFYVAARPLARLPPEVAALARAWVLVVPAAPEDQHGRRPSFEVCGLFGYAPRARVGRSAA